MHSRWSGGVRLLLLLSLAACSDSPLDFGRRAYPEVMSPLADQTQDTPPAALPDVRYLAVYKTTPPRPEQVLALIGPEGGSLRAGDFEIIVPAGAVARSTLFRISLPAETGNAKHAFAEFNTSSAFLLPVTIRLPFATTNASPNSEILWWADDHWVPMPTTVTADGRLETTTTHFSIYGVSLFKGITTLGG